MKSFRFVASSLLVPFSLSPLSIAVAQESIGETMDPIVVTATLGPKTVGESLASVTVIDEEEIRSKAPADFSDLLRGQPGINVTDNGAFGKTTSVFIRGNASDATVLLVDGIRIRSATLGGAAWQHLPPQLISRVEIVRGSRSSLYGADATGGVIQAFTLPQSEGTRGWAEVGAGNYDSQRFGAGAAVANETSKLSIGVNRFQTDGTAVVETGEDKGYERTSGVISGSHTFGNQVRAGFTFLNSEGNTEYVGDNQDYVFQVAGLNLDIPITENYRTLLQFSDARDESENFISFPGVFNTNTRNSRIENWLTLGTHEFVLGAEYTVDQVDSTTPYDENSRSNGAFFGQALLNFDALDVHLSLRSDDNEAFGTKETWGVGLGYAFDRSYRVRASVGTSFKAPTFNDLYFPGFGNPDLQPEEATSYELGVEGRYTNWFWDIALFQSDVDDLSLGTRTEAGSVPEARLRGIELSSGWNQNGWSLNAAATIGDYENTRNGKQLRRRAEDTVRLDLDKKLGPWSLGTTVRAESHRYDDRENDERVAGFGVWDIRAKWHFAQNWSTRLTLVNVLDKEYSTAKYFDGRNYISAGRTAMLSVRYDIQ